MTVETLQNQLLDLKDQLLEAKQNLARLHADFENIKSSLSLVVAPPQEAVTEITREARVAKAKNEIFTEYDSLLSELAK